jgi:hypothetical protein
MKKLSEGRKPDNRFYIYNNRVALFQLLHMGIANISYLIIATIPAIHSPFL